MLHIIYNAITFLKNWSGGISGPCCGGGRVVVVDVDIVVGVVVDVDIVVGVVVDVDIVVGVVVVDVDIVVVSVVVVVNFDVVVEVVVFVVGLMKSIILL